MKIYSDIVIMQSIGVVVHKWIQIVGNQQKASSRIAVKAPEERVF
jgi:hypothetical protein